MEPVKGKGFFFQIFCRLIKPLKNLKRQFMRDPGKIRLMWNPVCHVFQQITLYNGGWMKYMKLINIHDVEVSISAWVSHVMPLESY